jgi:hypothetical protein
MGDSVTKRLRNLSKSHRYEEVEMGFELRQSR